MTVHDVQRKPREVERSSEYFGIAVGVLGTLVLSALLIPFRGHLASADLALILVLPVLLGAILGGRWAGGASALMAAACFDFFFTQPYLSLRISSSEDITTAVVLLVVAAITSEVGIRARRGMGAARDSHEGLERVSRVADVSARGQDLDVVIAAVRDELRTMWHLAECRFEAGDVEPHLPRLGPRGAIEGAELVIHGREFLLPAGEVELPVVGRGHRFGRLVLVTDEPTTASIEQRLAAMVMADELGLALAARTA